MKKFKLGYLLLIPLIFSGCTVEYNLKIADNYISENISINEKASNFSEEYAENRLQNTYSQNNANGTQHYIYKKTTKKDMITYNLSQSYNLNKGTYIKAFAECFDAYNIVYNDDSRKNYVLQTSKGFKCLTYEYMNIDSVKLNITVENKVLDNNADEVNGNVYTWYFNKDNYEDKYVSITFRKYSKDRYTHTKKKKISLKVILMIIGLILGLVVVILLDGIILNKKRNKV